MDTSAVLDDTKTQRIHQLETILEEYKLANDQLSKEIDTLGGSSSSVGEGRSRQDLSLEIETERLEKIAVQKGMSFINIHYQILIQQIDLERAEAESKENIRRIEELEQSLFELSGEIAGGRHVPPGVRILSMKENPEQEWFDLRQATMDRLKAENEALMKILKELEENGARRTHGTNTEVVPRESWELANREKKELEDTIRQKEKRLLRLQQVCQNKTVRPPPIYYNWIILGVHLQKR